jgi:hypothetical protein
MGERREPPMGEGANYRRFAGLQQLSRNSIVFAFDAHRINMSLRWCWSLRTGAIP